MSLSLSLLLSVSVVSCCLPLSLSLFFALLFLCCQLQLGILLQEATNCVGFVNCCPGPCGTKTQLGPEPGPRQCSQTGLERDAATVRTLSGQLLVALVNYVL